MEELYLIMRNFLEVEYNQKALAYVLEALEVAYSEEEQKEAKFIANTAKYFLKSSNTELRAAISQLDKYMAASINKS